MKKIRLLGSNEFCVLLEIYNMIDFVEACHETIDFETKSMHFRSVFRYPQRTRYCTDCQNIHTRPSSYMAPHTKKIWSKNIKQKYIFWASDHGGICPDFLQIRDFYRVYIGFYNKWILSRKTENEPRSNRKWSLELISYRLIVLMGTSKPENMSF